MKWSRRGRDQGQGRRALFDHAEAFGFHVRLLRRPEGRGELLITESAAEPAASQPRDLWLVAGLVEQLGGRLNETPGRVRFEFQAEDLPPAPN